MTQDLATAFAHAVARKDSAAMLDLLHPDVDFRGMTPGKVWDAASPADVVDILGTWFDSGDVIEGVDRIDADAFADRQSVGYRLRVRNAEGLHLVDQQAYLSERDGRVGWLRVMCAGYRPVTETLDADPSRSPRVRAPTP